MQVGEASVCCAGLVVVTHMKQAVGLAGTEGPPDWIVGLAAETPVSDSAVHLQDVASPDLLEPLTVKNKCNAIITNESQ